MQDFYGWKSANMTMEYISTSRAAVQSMASSLYPLEAAGMSAGIMEPEAAGKTLAIKPTGDIPDHSIKNNQKVIIVYGNFSGTIN